MADDLKYGYKGAEPTQSFGNNTGVFDPNDINNLIADNKWTSFGQLELIETQTVSSTVSAVEFLNLGNYNVHFFTYNNVQCTTDAKAVALQFKISTGYVTSTYQYAYQYGIATGTFGPVQSTSQAQLFLAFQTGTAGNEKQNGYSYFYNLTDSSKYSFHTKHSSGQRNDPAYIMGFGSGVYPTANEVIGFKVFGETTTNIETGTFSLYGIRYS